MNNLIDINTIEKQSLVLGENFSIRLQMDNLITDAFVSGVWQKFSYEFDIDNSVLVIYGFASKTTSHQYWEIAAYKSDKTLSKLYKVYYEILEKE